MLLIFLNRWEHYRSLAKIFISQIIDVIISQERLVGAVTSAAIYPTRRAVGGAK